MAEKRVRWRDIIFILTIIFLSAYIISPGFSLSVGRKKVGEISLSGTISYQDSLFSQSLTPDKVERMVDKIEKKDLEAVIVKINSGGGSVVASKDIARQIKRINIPTVCLQKDVAASGAYWISISCDKIVSDPYSITGGVGVRSGYLEYSGLLDKLGIEYVRLISGKYKDAGSPYRNITEEEKKMLQDKLGKVQNGFIEEIKQRREIEQNTVKEIKTGKTFLGERAKELNLVDQLGGEKEAIELAENITDEDDLKKEKIRLNSGNSLLNRMLKNIGYGIGASLRQSFQQVKENPHLQAN